MTLNGIMALILRYFTELVYNAILKQLLGLPRVSKSTFDRLVEGTLVSLDGVAPSQMVGVSASVNLPLHHKVQKFSSGTGSPGWSRKKGRKMGVAVLGKTRGGNSHDLD